MIIGQATLGIEMMEENANINAEAVILPTSINGCGLITGIAMAIKGRNSNIKIIKVKSALHDSLIKSIRKETMSQQEIKTKPENRYDWFKNKKGGIQEQLFYKIFNKVEDRFVKTAKILLKEENIDDLRAAIGLAALLSGKLDELKGKKIVIPVFGEMDLSDDKTDDNPSSEPRAGPSNA
ncbi:uncharacterized protein LOC112452822 [Temnothorax curvispinosus]|uniref:Uncharacterized protein LOC112452822 n=1 Tax=Temnothorax curvispinosus TaxID=300111 RepID=A0A6J1PIB5_9HYME|nr:uncharacterized protein LOC112452822 [Temnothorax curvispinosus]